MSEFTVVSAGYDFKGDLNPTVVVCGTVDGVRACATMFYKTLYYAYEAGGVQAVQHAIAISLVNSFVKNSDHPMSVATGGKYLELPQYPMAKSIPAPAPGKSNTLDIALVPNWTQDVVITNATNRQVLDNQAWVESLKPRNRRK
jgi:hypothetical protein